MVDVGYLIPQVRLRIGDVNPQSYRYLDEWIRTALIVAIRALGRRWDNKYLVTDGGIVYRNPNYTDFEFPEDPNSPETTIQPKDEYPIILQTAIVLVSGALENLAWNLGSWRDEEIYYSNTEAGRAVSELLRQLRDELDSILKPPQKKLARGTRVTILEAK